MNAKNTFTRLENWDMGRVRDALVKDGELSRHEVQAVETEYKKFLSLGFGVPSKKVDLFWHKHILHTRDYMAMCTQVFDGVFIHHEPAVDGELTRLQKVFTQMMVLYETTFGPPSTMWTDTALCQYRCLGGNIPCEKSCKDIRSRITAW